jgi:predicted esterase
VVKKAIVLLSVLLAIIPVCLARLPEVIDKAEYLIYIPSGIDTDKKYLLIVALSPSADAQSTVNTWKSVAEKYKWIIFASKEFRNGIDMEAVLGKIATVLKKLFLELPIDKSKVIATGFSGGGMGAHGFSFLHPELIQAVIVNTGMMHEYYIGKKSAYPQGKIAIFLASPTDFRYGEMKRDCAFLESLSWKTKWIEFEGGHRLAPATAYDEAAWWLTLQFL